MRGRELKFLVKVLFSIIDELNRLLTDNDFDTEEDRLETYHFTKNAEVYYTYINTKDKETV